MSEQEATAEKGRGGIFSPSHSLACVAVQPEDCVSRKVRVFYDEAQNRYAIELELVWKEGQEPIITRLVLSHAAAEMLVSALADMFNNRPRWRHKAPLEEYLK